MFHLKNNQGDLLVTAKSANKALKKLHKSGGDLVDLELTGCDGFDAKYYFMYSLILNHSQFYNRHWQGVHMERTALIRAKFKHCSFYEGSCFSDSTLAGTSFESCLFKNATFAKIHFSTVKTTDTFFTQCVFTDCNFTGYDITTANFGSCDFFNCKALIDVGCTPDGRRVFGHKDSDGIWYIYINRTLYQPIKDFLETPNHPNFLLAKAKCIAIASATHDNDCDM